MNTMIANIEKPDICLTATQVKSFLQVGSLSSYQIEWSDCAKVTPMGGMVFFGHYLHANGLFDKLVDECPLTYISNNAPDKRSVIGTIVSGLLNGARRYAHLSHITNDSLCADALNIKDGFVSEDSVRRGLVKVTRTNWSACDAWLLKAELASVLPLLSEPYILDIDTSVKPIYGHQEGAEVGYNPTRPGRPSQALHMGFIGGLRMVVAVDVQGGKAHAASHMASRIWQWVDRLPPGCRPRLIRGDIGFGNERYLCECESRGLPHLFKLKITAKVKNLIGKLALQQGQQWTPAPGGWDVLESCVKLSGWSRERRVIVMRRPFQTGKSKRHKDMDLLPGLRLEVAPEWEYAVLVCSRDVPIESAPKLYAERADCENVLDEVKNQWGLRGFTTKDLKRGKVMARLNALVCNWWNVFVRIAEPTGHKEAVTSRPELLHLIATLTTHAGKNVIHFNSLHENSHTIKRAFNRLHTVLSHIDANAEQLDRPMIWAIHLSVAFYAWLRGKILKVPSAAEKIIRELTLAATPAPS